MKAKILANFQICISVPLKLMSSAFPPCLYFFVTPYLANGVQLLME